jgi:LTXXQ motif family protein
LIRKFEMQNIGMGWKAASVGGIVLVVCLAAGTGWAQRGHPGGGGGGGPHPGGGGGPHFGGGGGPHLGGGPHFAPHMGAAPHVAPHFNVGRAAPHVGGPHIAHFGRPVNHGHINHVRTRALRQAHGRTPHGPGAIANHPTGNRATENHNRATENHRNAAVGGNPHTAITAAARASDPRHFADHRHFADNAAFRPFLRRGFHPHGHLGWIGPLFWPYAYGDFFYYALWPDEYEYVDPYWAYGYGDIYEGIFSPDDYQEYVQGSGAQSRMATLTQSLAQSCGDEVAEVTGWPIDQIRDAVQPNPQQSALLDDLNNAVAKASDIVRAHCPTTVSFTPTGRLADMRQRLEGMVQAVHTVLPPLSKFYDSLSDEQKARFNDIGAQEAGRNESASRALNAQAACDASAPAWPTEQINRVVHPDDTQRAKLEALQAAAAQAQDMVKASCEGENPVTPPSRLAAVGKHLQAMLQAVETMQPPLNTFYDSLSDDQKARFNTMGRQLFAEK